MNSRTRHDRYMGLIAAIFASWSLTLLLGCTSLDSTAQLNNQGLRYWDEGRYDQAERTLTLALQQAQQNLGPSHFNVGITLVNLGLVYTDEGKYAEAVEVYQRADPLIKNYFGSDAPTYAQFLNNYGYAYLRYGKYTQAREKIEQSLSIYDAAGESPAETANVTNGLSMTYLGAGDLTKAETVATSALNSVSNDESKWGYRGPILQNLGNIYIQQGRYDKAEEAYTKVLERREMQLGTSHPETGRTVAALAVLYVKEGKNEKADAYFRRALDIFERRLPPDHPDTVQLIREYSDFLKSMGRNDEAPKLEQRNQVQ